MLAKIILFSSIILFSAMIPFDLVFATSGACSSHGGVNCDIGPDYDGSVICNDGWNDSSTLYTDEIQCYSINECPMYVTQDYFNQEVLDITGTKINMVLEMPDIMLPIQYSDSYYATLNYLTCLEKITEKTTFESGYTNYDENTCTSERQSLFSAIYSDNNTYGYLFAELLLVSYKYDLLILCMNAYEGDYCSSIIENSTNADIYSCECVDGYEWNEARTFCNEIDEETTIDNKEESQETVESTEEITSEEVAPTSSSPTRTLIKRLTGYILLQVERHGEAWYVNPTDHLRYYMKDGEVAYEMMRSSGLGITDADLELIPSVDDQDEMLNTSSVCSSNSVANRLSGRILLQVEQHGEAWYIHPDTCKRIYMADGDAAYTIMRYLSLGITDIDLEKIEAGEIK